MPDGVSARHLIRAAAEMALPTPEITKEAQKSWIKPVDYMIDPHPKKIKWKPLTDRSKLYATSYPTPVEGVLVTLYNPRPDRLFTVWDYSRIASAINEVAVHSSVPMDKETRCFCYLVAQATLKNHPKCVCTHPAFPLKEEQKTPTPLPSFKKVIKAANEEDVKAHIAKSKKMASEARVKKEAAKERRIELIHERLEQHREKVHETRAKRLSGELNALENYGSKFMVQNCLSKIKTFGIKNLADNNAKILEIDFSGMLLKINNKEFWTPLIGKFNVSNLLAVFSVANVAGIKSIEILRILSQTKGVNGRFEILKTPNNAFVIIDYAHTPNSLENVIDTISQIRTKNELFVTIIGCGGDRDAGKRSKMGKIVLNGCDKVIFTSDNPRYEEPEKIIDDMLFGIDPNNIKKISKIINRREAIQKGCSQLNSGDILLVVGKGHETYQEIKGEKIPFSDIKIVKESFS